MMKAPPPRRETRGAQRRGRGKIRALVRRARNNPKLAEALPRYLSPHSIPAAEELSRKTPREIAAAAREMRRVAREKFEAWLAEQDAKKAAA